MTEDGHHTIRKTVTLTPLKRADHMEILVWLERANVTGRAVWKELVTQALLQYIRSHEALNIPRSGVSCQPAQLQEIDALVKQLRNDPEEAKRWTACHNRVKTSPKQTAAAQRDMHRDSLNEPVHPGADASTLQDEEEPSEPGEQSTLFDGQELNKATAEAEGTGSEANNEDHKSQAPKARSLGTKSWDWKMPDFSVFDEEED